MPGGTALEDVGDVYVLAREAYALEHLVEQLARGAHEGLTLQVLILTRRLADEHDLGPRIARTGNDVRARVTQPALVAIVDTRQRLAQRLVDVVVHIRQWFRHRHHAPLVMRYT